MRRSLASLLVLSALALPVQAQQPCPTTCAGFVSPPAGLYEDAFAVTAAIYVDDTSDEASRRNDPNGIVAACIGGTIRAAQSASPVLSNQVYFVSVEGNSSPPSDVGEAVTFKYCSPQDGSVTVVATPSGNADDTPTFSPSATEGSAGAPYKLLVRASELPVELTHFGAQLSRDGAVLTWETASETGNMGFEVEHAAAADAFSRAGWVEGAGTTLETNRYRFQSARLAPGRHRFRLRQIDLDGAFELSPVVELSVGTSEAYAMSAPNPHPARASSHITMAVGRDQNVEVTLFDTMGRAVRTLFSSPMQRDQAQQIEIEVRALPAGLYVVRAEGETFVATQTLTVVR